MSVYVYDDRLSHHGVLGMKWGIRRYQPYPGGFLRKTNGRYFMRKEKKNEPYKERYDGPGGSKEIDEAYEGKHRGDRFKKDHVIPKGTTFYRTAPKGDPASQNRKDIYVTYLEPDRDLYRGDYQEGLKDQYGDKKLKLYERSYVLRDDLKVPGEDAQRAAFEKVMKTKNNLYKVNRSRVDLMFKNEDFKDEMVRMDLEKTYKSSEIDSMPASKYKKAYETALEKVKNDYTKLYTEDFGSLHKDTAYMWESWALGTNPDIRSKLASELKKEGYNAMIDQASVGGTGGFNVEGIEPLIIFDKDSSLKLESETKISDETRDDASKKYTSWKNRTQVNLRDRGGNW